jgi:hypothetical protein
MDGGLVGGGGGVVVVGVDGDDDAAVLVARVPVGSAGLAMPGMPKPPVSPGSLSTPVNW